MRVLGIESSCDETGVAIYDTTKGLLSDVLHSQIIAHRQYGGVVPELASRDHLKELAKLVEKALKDAGLTKQALGGIAYTKGPGLNGALLVGAAFAKSFALALGLPTIGVHHLKAHLLVTRLTNPLLSFPFLGLLVSGGHTALIAVLSPCSYELLGETLDDAAGEAFDKTAKLLGYAYPGGAKLAKLADESHIDTKNYSPFPRPMIRQGGSDFSFSGLKTHAAIAWHRSAQDEQAKRVIATLFQDAVVDTLVQKTIAALKTTGLKQLVVAGGVAANIALRKRFLAHQSTMGYEVFFPSLSHCSDNGAMIAYTGSLALEANIQDDESAISVQARWPL